MHLRKLVLACGFASFALSNYASALGLGEVKLKSTLNQPLSAEVQLLDTKGLSAEQIIVSLASVGDFERNGLDFTHFYSEFKFEVALDNPSGPVVRITSRNPVREPYLNFLVEAKWTSGRLLREYTLLMDLPTFEEATPKAVEAAQTSQAKPAATKSTKNADAAVAAEVQAAVDAANTEEKPDIIAEQDQPAKKSKIAADTYGPVGDKDTLWDIALSVRPDSSASVHQTMLALQRLNPQAFIRGNINLLKKGQVLRVPDAEEISSVSKSEAVSQFSAQTAEWSGASATSTGMGAQLDASTRSSTERVKSEAVAGRVKLEAPTAKDRSSSGQGSGANKGSGKALESELASTLEELDKAKSDKTELSSRVRDLEAQVKTMQRLVDVSNEKLRALQVNSAKQPGKADLAAKAADTKTTAEISAPVASQAAVSAASSETASSAAAVKPKKPVAKPAPVVVEPEKTLVDQLFDNILWIGLGAAGIIGAAGFAVMRRRKAQAEAAKLFDKDSDDLFTSEPNFDAFNQPEESASEPSADEMALFDEEDTSAVAETGDVVGEADIYIAYGKYDQAEEMLLNGLSKDPASTDIRLKLLEVYSQTQNPVEFDKHYAAILPFATGFALNRAKELRANIPGVGEFSPEIAVAEENLDFNTDFDLDDFEAPPAETSAASVTSDGDFDFDLDLDDGDIADTASGVEDAGLDVTSKANFGVDFSEGAEAPKSVVADMDDEFVLDFELDDTTNDKDAAEDLSDISLALDGLDDDALPDDIEVSSRSHEDEFSFDFNDLDTDTSSLAQEVDSIKSSEFNEDGTLGDDFNLEMDVNGLDLAALDNEMASFDAELDSLDDAQDKPAALAGESLAAAEDFNLDDIDDGLAELDAGLQGESLAELDADLDGSDFSWEEAQESEVEPELTSVAEDEFSLSEEEFALDDDDDFDIDSVAVLDTNTNLETLDAELEDGGLENQLNLDDEPEIDLEELDVELEKQSFAELEEGLNEAGLDVEDSELDEELDLDESMFDEDLTANESLAESTLNLEDDGHFDEAIEETFSEALPDAATATEEIDVLDAVVETEAEVFVEPAPLLDSAEEELADDDIFEQALSDFSAESLALDEEANMSDDDMDAELDFMADADEAATKLDLARAYMDMGDNEGARDILAEVAHEGNEQQRQEAVDLLSRIDA